MKLFVRLTVVLAVFMMALPLKAERIAAPEPESKDYLNAVKITFLSWFSGSTKISYERAFPNVRQSGEICGSLICAGYDKYHNRPMGFTVRYGHKFFLPDRDGLSLKGFYLRPEVMYSHYNYDRTADHVRTLASMGALLATVGYQYVYKRFLADFWVGGGMRMERLRRPDTIMGLNSGTGSARTIPILP